MKPYVGSIERQTHKNRNFRQVICTGTRQQLVVMTLEAGQDIGNEVHEDTDQFFHVEEGEAKFVFGGKVVHLVEAGDAVLVPAGTFHNVINASATQPLRLYTLYSPPKYRDGTVQKAKPEAEVVAQH